MAAVQGHSYAGRTPKGVASENQVGGMMRGPMNSIEDNNNNDSNMEWTG
jgi:hypothetical protein